MKNAKIAIVSLVILTCSYYASSYVKNAYLRFASSTAKLEDVRQQVGPSLNAALADVGLRIGLPTYIRVFKEEQQLEVWLEEGGTFKLTKTYQICNFSGDLGPKSKREIGSRQKDFIL